MRGLYKHLPTNKLVFIINGEYEINKRISNLYWGNVLDENGELTNEELGDYGQSDIWEEVKNYKVKIEKATN